MSLPTTRLGRCLCKKKASTNLPTQCETVDSLLFKYQHLINSLPHPSFSLAISTLLSQKKGRSIVHSVPLFLDIRILMRNLRILSAHHCHLRGRRFVLDPVSFHGHQLSSSFLLKVTFIVPVSVLDCCCTFLLVLS